MPRGGIKNTCVQVWPKSILVDAGPLIALGRVRDADHRRAMQFAAAYTGTLITTLAVIAEVCHFVRERKIELFAQIRNRTVVLEDIGVADMARLTEICVKYPRADFADASLIVVAERTGIIDIATLDDTDFSVYRTKGGKHFINLF